VIDAPGIEAMGDDLAGWGPADRMLRDLAGFLGAAVEAREWREARSGSSEPCETECLFPAVVVAWARDHADEVAEVAEVAYE